MKLSVALCTYNGSKYIEEQINSILNQTINVDEIIVCDDLSTDNTIEILKKIQQKYPIISIIQNDVNLKSTKNFEKAIQLCTGDYIFLSDQDDVWQNNKVEKILSIFKENPSAEGVFSNANLINEDGVVFTQNTIWDSVFFLEKELKKPIDLFDIIAKNGNVITGATLCIKKQIKEFIFPFSENILHDEWIAAILALKGSLYYSTESLISYRIHNNQQVGMKNLNKIDKKIQLKKVILGINPPKKYNEYRLLLKKIYLKQIDLIKYNALFPNLKLDTLIANNYKDYTDLNKKTSQLYPIQHKINLLIDQILKKRVINEK
jgi:glycosyltransferase involved in cell wall biosynthesis